MDTATKARRRAGRMLRHRAAQLRKTADELDEIAAEVETGSNAPSECVDKNEASRRVGGVKSLLPLPPRPVGQADFWMREIR